jgi:hypothetical protein
MTVDGPCPTCGSTGAAMVDWARYAGELEALLRELRAWVKLPPHLEDAVTRLLDSTRLEGDAAAALQPDVGRAGADDRREGAEQLRLATARPAPAAS